MQADDLYPVARKQENVEEVKQPITRTMCFFQRLKYL